ncbi:hypothetical protein BpHYR1_041918, partial [Brachionus plicatilis]
NSKKKLCTYAKCTSCNEIGNDLACNTSNFIRHLKKCNSNIYNEFKILYERKLSVMAFESSDEKKELSQQNINFFIFKYLIVLCSLPLRLVETEEISSLNFQLIFNPLIYFTLLRFASLYSFNRKL